MFAPAPSAFCSLKVCRSLSCSTHIVVHATRSRCTHVVPNATSAFISRYVTSRQLLSHWLRCGVCCRVRRHCRVCRGGIRAERDDAWWNTPQSVLSRSLLWLHLVAASAATVRGASIDLPCHGRPSLSLQIVPEAVALIVVAPAHVATTHMDSTCGALTFTAATRTCGAMQPAKTERE